MMWIPYTYLIGWSWLDRWYYGVEYAAVTKVANPQNLWTTYFTSSKQVAAFREEHGEPDVVHVRRTFSGDADAREWERKVLRRVGVVKSERWLNMFDGKAISPEAAGRAGRALRGKKRPPRSAEWCRRLGEKQKGRILGPYSEERRAKLRKPKKNTENMKGPLTEEHRAAMRKPKRVGHGQHVAEANVGVRFYNDGVVMRRCKECPLGFVAGMLPRRKLNV